MSSAEATPVPTIKASSSDFSPKSLPGSPEIYTGRPEVVDLPIFQSKDSSVFVLLTLPSSTLITAVAGITKTGRNLLPHYKVASPQGDANGFNFDERTRFIPGDYCLGISFRSSEEAQSVSTVRIGMQAEPISNFMLSQMIFGLYRALGLEPSHVMKYPAKSMNPNQPFYRKIRSEISKSNERLAALEQLIRTPADDRLTELNQQLERIGSKVITVDQMEDQMNRLIDSRQEKGGSETISLETIEQLILEKEALFNKLREAEDFIEEQLEEKEKPPAKANQWFNPSWKVGRR